MKPSLYLFDKLFLPIRDHIDNTFRFVCGSRYFYNGLGMECHSYYHKLQVWYNLDQIIKISKETTTIGQVLYSFIEKDVYKTHNIQWKMQKEFSIGFYWFCQG